MAFPSPDDYDDWKPYVKALLASLDGGALASLIIDDPYASAVIGGSGGDGTPAGYSPVWLSDSDALLYLGQSTIPPTAGALFNIETTNLADLAVSFNKLGIDAVHTTNILDAAILTAKIGDLQVVTAKIADLAVNNAKIANLAVSSAKIANLAVGTGQIDNLAVTTAKIGLLQVATGNIDNLAVNNAKLATLSVATANIQNLAVDTAQINNLAVTQAKVGLLAVGTAQIIDASILTAKIADLQVLKVKIGNYEIDATKLESLAVSSAGLLTSALGTSVVSGGYVDLVMGGVTISLDVAIPNITGAQAVRCFVTLEAGAAALRQGRLRITRDGVATTTAPISAKMAIDTIDATHTFMFVDDSPTPGATHSYTVQVLQSTGNWTARNMVYSTQLFKR